MKLAYKLVISFLLVTVLMGAFGFYMFNDVSNKLSAKQEEIRNVTDLTVAIESFHIENFHTQLKMWQYAYYPTQEGLNSFYGHLVLWEDSLAAFNKKAGKADLSQEEKALVGKLSQGVGILRSGWMNFVRSTSIVATGVLLQPTLSDDGSAKYPNLDKMGEYGYAYSYPMFDMASVKPDHILLSSGITQMEVAFDKIGFNTAADKFVELQIKKIDARQAEMAVLKSALSTQFIIMFVIILLVAIALALLLTRMIVTPINKLSKVADEVSQGKTDLAVPDIKSRDEIGDLAKSFGRMVASLKFILMDKEG
jgi:HAMP domain-containing protein